MKKFIVMILQINCIILLILSFNGLITALPVPIKLAIENPVMNEIKKDLKKLGASQQKIPDLSNAVYTSHKSTGLNPKLIVALMYTESGFNKTAVGPPNRTKIRYSGLLQTPFASKEFSDVDVLFGVRILEQKLKSTNYDVRTALALYKGGNNPTAFRQADQVLKIYKEL